MDRESEKRAREFKDDRTLSCYCCQKPIDGRSEWLRNPQDYRAEQFILDNAIDDYTIAKAEMAFVATFCMLRRRQIGARVKRLVQRAKQTYELDPPPSQNKPKGIMRRALRFGFDTSVSLFVGYGVLFYYMDFPLLGASFGSVPLVPSRSAISDELCQDMAQAYHKHLDSSNIEMDSAVTTMVRTFVRNCELREAYEQKLRREQGLSDDAPVSIPDPGVPMDYTLKKNAYTLTGDDDDDEALALVASDTNNVKDWAKSLVADQEEDDKGTSKKRTTPQRKE